MGFLDSFCSFFINPTDPMHHAASTGNVEKVAKLLREFTKDRLNPATILASVNAFNAQKETPLNCAFSTTTSSTKFNAALLLLLSGADPYLTSPDCILVSAPIHRAIRNHHLAGALLLILFNPDFENIETTDKSQTAGALLRKWDSSQDFPGIPIFQTAQIFARCVVKIREYLRNIDEIRGDSEQYYPKVIPNLTCVAKQYAALVLMLDHLMISAKQKNSEEIKNLETLRILCLLRQNQYTDSAREIYDNMPIQQLTPETQDALKDALNDLNTLKQTQSEEQQYHLPLLVSLGGREYAPAKSLDELTFFLNQFVPLARNRRACAEICTQRNHHRLFGASPTVTAYTPLLDDSPNSSRSSPGGAASLRKRAIVS